ncbi:MAG: hypothetical protein J1F29_06845 [Lentimicrobiaceae bacterium]|nr:hypothetical protein [Lentimicrobiaceae bacterium]
MFKIKHLLIIVFASLGAGSLFAQDDADLLRYSMLDPVGTARYNAMGGAFSALGANFTTLSTNPAGIGFYTRHELSLSMGIVSQNSVSDYYEQKNSLEKVKFNIPQGGGVFCIKNANPAAGKYWSLHLGVGANRLKDFNNNIYTKGVNTQSSYMQDVAAQSAGYDFARQHSDAAHIGNLAYQTGLIDYIDTLDYTYESFLGKGLSQKHILQEWGNITEMTFSFGGNWSDKVFFGLTLGVPIVDYTQKSVIEEANTAGLPLPHNFKSYEVRNRMDVSGTGVNLKLGLIYKPVHFFRVGVAFHTPTYYWLKENADMDMLTDMQYVWTNNDVLPNVVHGGYEDRYGLSTPLKGIFSTAFLIKNFGAIAVEGEIIDYRQMRMEVDDDIEYNSYITDIVKNNYRLLGVLRVGTEWRVNFLSIRAGYIWQSCPYNNRILENNWSNHTVTAGLGVNAGRWTIDFGLRAKLSKSLDNFYYLVTEDGTPLVQPAKIASSKFLYTLTVGCKF